MPRLAVSFRVAFSGVAFSLAVCGLGAGGSTAFAQVSGGDMSPAMQDAVDQSRQAINDCRDKRQRGELPSYKASAQCSNPRISDLAAAAQYPHMDLITQWLKPPRGGLRQGRPASAPARPVRAADGRRHGAPDRRRTAPPQRRRRRQRCRHAAAIAAGRTGRGRRHAAGSREADRKKKRSGTPASSR